MRTGTQRIRASLACLLLGGLALQGVATAADMAQADAKKAAVRDEAVGVYTQDLINAMDADKNHEVSKACLLYTSDAADE